MKILVVDDTARHRAVAIEQLGALHDLTVVESASQALELILEGGWDAVLTDNQLPGYSGKLEALGWGLAMNAAKSGTPLVAVVTDASHHHDFSSRLMDELWEKIVVVGESKALFTNRCLSAEGKDWGWALGVLQGTRRVGEAPRGFRNDEAD